MPIEGEEEQPAAHKRDDFEQDHDDPAYTRRNKNIDLLGVSVKLDEHGLPVLEPESMGDEGEKVAQPTNSNPAVAEKKQPAQKILFNPKDPLSPLMAAAEKSKVQLTLTVSVDLIDKDLYKVLSKNYKEADEKMVETMLSMVDQPSVLEAIRVEIKKHYAK